MSELRRKGAGAGFDGRQGDHLLNRPVPSPSAAITTFLRCLLFLLLTASLLLLLWFPLPVPLLFSVCYSVVVVSAAAAVVVALCFVVVQDRFRFPCHLPTSTVVAARAAVAVAPTVDFATSAVLQARPSRMPLLVLFLLCCCMMCIECVNDIHERCHPDPNAPPPANA